MIKNEIRKSSAIAIAAFMVFGANLPYASAYSQASNIQISQEIANKSLQNGVYKLSNIIKKENVKPYRGFFSEETALEVKDGKYYVTFTNINATDVSQIKVNIDGQEVEIDKNSIDEKSYGFTIELKTLESEIVMSAFMEAMNHNLTFEVGLNLDTLEVVNTQEPETPEVPQTPDNTQEPEVPEVPQTPDNTQEPETPDVSQTPDNSQKPSSQYKDGLYKLDNIVTDHAMPDMIRSIFGQSTTINIKDGKYNVTFNLPNYDYVGNIEITVDGKVVKHKQVNSTTDKTAKLIIDIPSIDSKIKMKMYSPITKKDSVFGVTLDKDNMKLISTNDESSSENINEDNNTVNNSNSSNTDSTTNNNNDSNKEDNNSSTKEEDKVVVVNGKRYTIKNQVTAETTTSQKMGRNFLNETSKIEEINGKKYVILTFTGLNMMNNHKIYVNGNQVSHQIVSKNSSSVTIKFLVPNLGADIKVGVFVVPMNFNSEFNVKLLEDTLTFESDFSETVSELPQTGTILSNGAVLMSGIATSVSGLLLNRRKKNK